MQLRTTKAFDAWYAAIKDRRAQGMTEIARRTGLSRESLYRSLADNGNPNLATLIKVCEALGLKLTLTAA